MNASTTADSADLLAGLVSLAAADDLTVGKDGFNKHFGYGYMTEAALFTAARATLAEAGLSGTISFEAGQHETIPTWNKDGQERPGILATVTARLTVRDKNGQQVECTAYGQGLDNADKAYYKAMTGAAKYVVQKALMIAVESDDTDSQDSGSVAGQSGGGQMTGPASDKQLGFLCALVKKGHYIEGGTAQDVEHVALRLARMQANDPELGAFVKIPKSVASDLIEKLQVIPANRTGEVLAKLAEWEGVNGSLPPYVGSAEPSAEAEAAASPSDRPATAPAPTDDIPF